MNPVPVRPKAFRLGNNLLSHELPGEAILSITHYKNVLVFKELLRGFHNPQHTWFRRARIYIERELNELKCSLLNMLDKTKKLSLHVFCQLLKN